MAGDKPPCQFIFTENKSYASPESDEKYGFGTHLIIQIRVWQKRGQISGPFYREVLSGQAFCRQRPCVS